jgi:hypothetical protein
MRPLYVRTAPFVLLALTLVTATARAQSVADMERKLLPFQHGPLSSLGGGFWEALALLRSEEDRQRALKADILFGLSGDEAGEKSLYKLNTGISLSRGDYPSELSVVSRLGMQLRDGVLQEDVTSLQITYDYHATTNLQYFAFAERFTDSFLSIQQRYEIGFGGRLAKHIGRLGGGRSIATGVETVQSALQPMRVAGSSNPAQLTAADLTRFDQAVDELQRAVRDRDSRLIIGIAASLFAEIERADLDVISIPQPGTLPIDSMSSRISLPSEQRYRLSIRPTLRWRPTSMINVRIFPYFKLPLDPPRRVVDANGDERLDYRRDIFSELAWSLPQTQTGLENVEFVLTYNHYFDNVPPQLTPATIAAELARGRVFTRAEAEGSHRVVALALRLRW